MKNTAKPKKNYTLLPILLGTLIIAAIIGGVIFLALQSKKAPERSATEPSDDGTLVDYEKEGTLTLGDYHTLTSLVKKEDLTDENTDDPTGLVWEEFMKTCKIKSYPKDLLDEALLDAQKQYDDFLEASGMSEEELIEAFNLDENTLKNNAKDMVKSRLVAKTIALREGLEMSDEEVRTALITLMDEDNKNVPLETILNDYVESTSVRPRDDAYVEKIKDYLMKQFK